MNGNGRGPPKDVAEKVQRIQEKENEIAVGKDHVEKLADNINWNNLSPFEQWVVAVLNENDMLE